MPSCLNPFTQQIYRMDLHAIWHCASYFSHLISIWTPSPRDNNKAQKHIAANLQKTKNEKINKKAGAEK